MELEAKITNVGMILVIGKYMFRLFHMKKQNKPATVDNIIVSKIMLYK